MQSWLIAVIAAAVYILCNLICFILMGCDKSRARKNIWRISERALFISCICFGGIGGVLGMRVFRHKTKHWYFRLFFPLIMVLQIILILIAAYLFFR